MPRGANLDTSHVEAEVTRLLREVRAGNRPAEEELIQLVYAELRRIAQKHLDRERGSHTLQPTALVNEAYLRVFGNQSPEFADRTHFLALMSVVMRRVLVDHARARSAARRGGSEPDFPLDERIDVPSGDDGRENVLVLDLDRALDTLAQDKPLIGKAVEMRFFGGMTAEEIATALDRSVHMVRKDLRYAQAWLRREMAR